MDLNIRGLKLPAIDLSQVKAGGRNIESENEGTAVTEKGSGLDSLVLSGSLNPENNITKQEKVNAQKAREELIKQLNDAIKAYASSSEDDKLQNANTVMELYEQLKVELASLEGELKNLQGEYRRTKPWDTQKRNELKQEINDIQQEIKNIKTNVNSTKFMNIAEEALELEDKMIEDLFSELESLANELDQGNTFYLVINEELTKKAQEFVEGYEKWQTLLAEHYEKVSSWPLSPGDVRKHVSEGGLWNRILETTYDVAKGIIARSTESEDLVSVEGVEIDENEDVANNGDTESEDLVFVEGVEIDENEDAANNGDTAAQDAVAFKLEQRVGDMSNMSNEEKIAHLRTVIADIESELANGVGLTMQTTLRAVLEEVKKQLEELVQGEGTQEVTDSSLNNQIANIKQKITDLRERLEETASPFERQKLNVLIRALEKKLQELMQSS